MRVTNLGANMRRFEACIFVPLLILLSASGCSHSSDAQSKFDLARKSFVRGDLAHARAEADASYNFFSSRDQKWAWKFRLLEAEILLDQGSSKDALSLVNSPLPGELVNSDIAIEQLEIQGSGLAQLDRFEDADRCLKDADALSGRLHSPMAGAIARARGVLEFRRNDFEAAGRFLRQSLQLARQGDDVHLQLTDLSNLGAVAERQERYDEAIDWLNSAYRTARTLEDRHTEQVALGNLAWVYYKMGDFDRALDAYREAEKIADGIGATYDRIGWLNNLGLVYYQLNRLEVAEGYYKESLVLARDKGNSELTVDALTSLAFVSAQIGRMTEAQQYSAEAFQKAHDRNDHPSELYPRLVEGEVAGARGKFEEAESVFREVAGDKDSDLSLRWQAQNDLAKLFEQEHRPHDADAQYQQALGTIEKARDSLQHEDYKLPFLANATHLYDDYVRFLVAQKKDQKALEFADYSRARTLAEGLGVLPQKSSAAPVALNAQQIARQAKATVLFYWLGREGSYLWAITGNQTKLYPLPAKAEIDGAVERYRQALLGWQDVLQAENSDGRYLYDKLVAPAQKLIAPNSRVILITDGSLDNLNLETLLAPQPKTHYWIEDVTVLSANSLRMLAAAQKPQKSGTGKLLLIGNAANASPDYTSLPYAEAEMADVGKHFSAEARQTYASAQATPAAYLASDPGQYSYIHFVAHATASEISPLDSAIVLSRSSAEQDSFKLYAREIKQHPLNATLVTISSCNGAGTKAYSGEGLVGLSWAFLRAGAHNIIGALWDVNDASTATLMDHLYDGLNRGQAPDVALRSAKLALLHSEDVRRKPKYWAPFQLYTGR